MEKPTKGSRVLEQHGDIYSGESHTYQETTRDMQLVCEKPIRAGVVG